MDLMFCCLGNGVTVCDRKRMEHGDYKNVCHISAKGEITFYVKTNTFSAEEMKRITDCAEQEREKYFTWFNSLPVADRYYRFLDDLSTSDFLSVMDRKKENGWDAEQTLKAYGY